MTVYVNNRAFETQADADRYLHGHNSYPAWPKVHHERANPPGTLVMAATDSTEATGYYDAEREYEARQEHKANLAWGKQQEDDK